MNLKRNKLVWDAIPSVFDVPNPLPKVRRTRKFILRKEPKLSLVNNYKSDAGFNSNVTALEMDVSVNEEQIYIKEEMEKNQDSMEEMDIKEEITEVNQDPLETIHIKEEIEVNQDPMEEINIKKEETEVNHPMEEIDIKEEIVEPFGIDNSGDIARRGEKRDLSCSQSPQATLHTKRWRSQLEEMKATDGLNGTIPKGSCRRVGISTNRRRKTTRTHLSVQAKLEVLKKLEQGMSVKNVCDKYGVKKQTVSDIKRAKAKLMEYASMYCVDVTPSESGSASRPRKHMKTGKECKLDAAVMKWYLQQRACGVNIHGLEIVSAANRLATKLGIADFRASDGWLWRFRSRHGLFNKVVWREGDSADMEEVEPFREKLKEIMVNEGLSQSQIYNAEETGLFWRSMPKNSQVRKGEKLERGKKMSKERISVLVGVNATGTHRLPLVVVGKARQPTALQHIMNSLPVLYFNSQKAWFTSAIVSEWFSKHFVPAVRKFQTEVLKIAPHEVKAVLLLDNAPVHPSEETLVSDDGRIRVMYLPPNTSSVIQPMDQGVISALKRRYIHRYLEEVLAVEETEEDEEEDRQGQRTIANCKAYTIRSAVFNLAYSWDSMKVYTIANSWNKLLTGTDSEPDFEGFQAGDIHQQLHRGGETSTSMDDVHEWIDEQENQDGYELMDDEDIIASVTQAKESDSSDGEDEDEVKKKKMSHIRYCVDTLLDYTTYSRVPEACDHYTQLRLLREIVIREQYMEGKQTKTSSFFAPRHSRADDAPVSPASPQPGTMDTADESPSPQPGTMDTADAPASPVCSVSPQPGTMNTADEPAGPVSPASSQPATNPVEILYCT